jgi:hypothetical protein
MSQIIKGKVMRKYLLATMIAGISATSAHAMDNQKTVCSHGNQTRVIEVVYTTEDDVPCEVRYSKEEGTKTLWSANNLAGYCEEKAAGFVEKQKGWGWNCEAAAVEASTDESEVSATPASETEASIESAEAQIETAEAEPVSAQ